MGEDFLLIARDFYTHEFANIPEYQDVECFDIYSGEDWPELMFNRFTLGLMMNAVNSGSEYTKALFLYFCIKLMPMDKETPSRIIKEVRRILVKNGSNSDIV